MSKIYTNKFTRRKFLWLGGSSWLALPMLSSLYPRNSFSQASGDFSKPFFINVPQKNAMHGKDFFGNLPETMTTGNGWTPLGSRCRARSFDNFEVSPIFNFMTEEEREKIYQNMTLIAGTYNGYEGATHDYSLCSTLFSQIKYESSGSKSPNFFNHKNATIDQRIAELTGIKILNVTYLDDDLIDNEPRLYGKVGSCNKNGVQSTGISSLDTLSSIIFGGGTSSPQAGGVDKRKFFEHALTGLSDLLTSRFGSKLSRVDRLSLKNVEEQMSLLKNNYQAMSGGTVSGLDDLKNYDSNIGNYTLESCQTIAQSHEYLDAFTNMIVAGVVSGKYHWVNVGSYAHFKLNFSDGEGFDKKFYDRNQSHEPSHSLDDLNTSQNNGDIRFLKELNIAAYKNFYSLIVKKLASIDHPMGGKFIDHGIVQVCSEHCSGNFHDTGAKSSDFNPYYGLPLVWFGGLKGENPYRGKILDFRSGLGSYKQPMAFRQFLGRSIFNAFGITESEQIKTEHGHHVGYYSQVDDNTPGWDPNHLDVVTKSLKQLTA